MPRSRRRTRLAVGSVLTAGLIALASCSESPTEPAPKVTVHRTVTAVLRDSLDDPIAGASLVWTAQFDSAGLVEVRYATTNADGENLQVLGQGGWIVTTSPAPQAAGASLVVAGAERAAADTQAVRLTMHTASRTRGRVTLAGRTDHRGTIVTGDAGGLTVTDSTGVWALDGMPLGRWTMWTEHLGFQSGVFQVVVVTPGSLVIVAPVTLVSEP